jgi:hypothetical protein
MSMNLLASKLVDFDALWKIVLVGFAAGAGVVVAFGFVLVARSRYAVARQGDLATRGGYVLMGVLGGGFCAVALVAGFIAMTTK